MGGGGGGGVGGGGGAGRERSLTISHAARPVYISRNPTLFQVDRPPSASNRPVIWRWRSHAGGRRSQPARGSGRAPTCPSSSDTLPLRRSPPLLASIAAKLAGERSERQLASGELHNTPLGGLSLYARTDTFSCRVARQ